MSTSPSWFDADKFSSLVRKVGVKPVSEPEAAPLSADDVAPALRAGMAKVGKLRTVVPEEPSSAVSGDGSDRLAAVEEELARTASERDQARRAYADLRQEFETLKQQHARLQDGAGPSAEDGELRQQLEAAQSELAARETELAASQQKLQGMRDVIETLKHEANSLQEQVLQLRDEEEAAKQMLAAAEEELQEAKAALQKAGEGASFNQTHFDDLKKECSTLIQQNMLLQAQQDQLARELSMTKAKLAARGA